MSDKDLYAILGVSRTATADEIKRAYRALAKKYHPDQNRNDATAEARFKEIQHAYSVLNDKDKRARYDQFGEIGAGDLRTKPGGEKVYTWGTSGQTINVEDLESLFSAFGGGFSGGGFAGGVEESASPFERFFRGRSRRSRQPAATRGQDLTRRINLAFEQAVRGVTIEVDLGTRSPRGKREMIEVNIPPGVEDGAKIRVRGKGTPGVGGGPNGDLYLVCAVRPHARFRRSGRDILLDIPVSISQAVLGAKVDVPTLDGDVTLTIPPGTSSGSKMRLRGKGVPAHNGAPVGDQFVVVQIVVPKTLTEEQRRLFESLAETAAEGSPRSETVTGT
jgi:DnaJ-class molecular chaperone